MSINIILTSNSWNMTDMDAGPSRVAPTAFAWQHRVKEVSWVRGEVSHVTTEDSVINSVVGETIAAVEPAAAADPRCSYSWISKGPHSVGQIFHVCGIIDLVVGVFICFLYIWLFICVIPYVCTMLTLFLFFFYKSVSRWNVLATQTSLMSGR